jgi:hypothetical protein
MILLSQVLPIPAKNVIILGRLPILVWQGAVESIFNFQDRKMLKVFFNTVNREDFFNEGFLADSICSASGATLIAFFGVNLVNPTCIPVADRAHGNLRMNATELEFIEVEGIVISHSRFHLC